MVGRNWLAGIMLGLAALAITPDAGRAQDRYEGYYYPPIGSFETFDRVLQVTPPAARELRIEFATLLTLSQRDVPYAPQYTAFAKGGEAETLIVIALEDEIFRTLYRARAVMARTTASIRATEFFVAQGLQFDGTFYDMLQILQFNRLILTDGETWTHEVRLVRP